ncbi:alpha/beta hydrolase [Streptomyces sp. SAS_270]|uniref:alpha/beta hydrolase n=1 Tax=Streptomyces sp. SAS_270 TaxID=3412748 RepID=UPI00403D1BEB
MTSPELKSVVSSLMEAKAQLAGMPMPEVEEIRRATTGYLASFPEVEGVEITETSAGGVPSEWTTPAGLKSDDARTLLYFHGGGFIQNSPTTHRRIVSTLAIHAGLRALSIDYRLAPEHPYPAAIDDAVTAYTWLIDSMGTDPEAIVLAGDSAGGTIVAALLIRLRDEGRPLPRAAYLISPALDFAATGESIRTRRDTDPMMTGETLGFVTQHYLQGGEDVKDPNVSPLYAELHGLPPLLIQVGDREMLLDDSKRFAKKAEQASVSVELEIWDDAFHVFQFHVGVFPEAEEALHKAATWIRSQQRVDPSS